MYNGTISRGWKKKSAVSPERKIGAGKTTAILGVADTSKPKGEQQSQQQGQLWVIEGTPNAKKNVDGT